MGRASSFYPPYGGRLAGGGGGIPEPPSGGDWARRVVTGVGSWVRRPAFTGVDLIDTDPTGTKYPALTLEHPDSYFIRLGNNTIDTAVRKLSLVDNSLNLHEAMSLDNYASPTAQKYAYNPLRILIGDGNADRIEMDAGGFTVFTEVGDFRVVSAGDVQMQGGAVRLFAETDGVVLDATAGNDTVDLFAGTTNLWEGGLSFTSGTNPTIAISRDGGDPSALNIDSNLIAPSVLADYLTAYVQMRLRDAGTGDVHNVAEFDDPGTPGFMYMGGDFSDSPALPLIFAQSAFFDGDTITGAAARFQSVNTDSIDTSGGSLSILKSLLLGAGIKIIMGGGTIEIISGAADPEGSVSAPNGSIYLRSNGTEYSKASGGGGNTGWKAVLVSP